MNAVAEITKFIVPGAILAMLDFNKKRLRSGSRGPVEEPQKVLVLS